MGRSGGASRVPVLAISAALCLQGMAFGTDGSPVTYKDGTYLARRFTASADKPQSKLWYAAGSWWGALTTAGGRVEVHLLSNHAWVSTGVLIDARSRATTDALWTGTTLYTATRDDQGELRVSRFAFDATRRTYTRATGFPVVVARGGTESMTIDRDSLGQLWAAWTQSKRVWVAHSLPGDDRTWTSPFAPGGGTDVTVSADDIAAVSAVPGAIAVMWSDQESGAFRLARHPDGAPDDLWTVETPRQGPYAADDHINMKTVGTDADGRLLIAVKNSTDLQTPAAPPSTPQVEVLARAPQGGWTSATIGTLADRLTRPLLLVDSVQGLLRAFFTVNNPDHGEVHWKTASLQTLAFPTGRGTPFVIWPATNINNASSSKLPVSPATGIVVLASDADASRYYHGELAPSSAVTVATTTAPSSVSVTTQSGGGTVVGWQPSGDAVRSYRIYRDEGRLPIAVVDGRTRRVTDSDAVPGSAHRYGVAAVGQDGVQSPVRETTVLLPPDTERPGAPRDLTAVRSPGTTKVAWRPSLGSGPLLGYRVLRDGRQIAVVSSSTTDFADATADEGWTRHVYAVVAVDVAGQDSLPALATER